MGNIVNQIRKLMLTKWDIDLKSGCSRSCVLIGNYAIKYPRVSKEGVNYDGLNGNWNEWILWRREKNSKIGQLLCPILFGLPPYFLVFPRAQQVQTVSEHDRTIFEEFKDLKPENIGIYQGRLVQLDYGLVGNGLWLVNMIFWFKSIPCQISSYIRQFQYVWSGAINFDYSIRENILIINFWNYHLRVGVSKSGRNDNETSGIVYSKYNHLGDLLPVSYSLPFGLMNIYPRYSPLQDDKILKSGQLIPQIAPSIRCKIRKPYRASDFGFLKGRFIITKYDYL